MKDTFLKHALPTVLQFEGGYSDDPNDPGGATNFGITHYDYDQYRKSNGEPHQDVRNITQTEVVDIYRNKYWVGVNGDSLPYPIDWLQFDCAVNMGIGTANEMLSNCFGGTGAPV